MSPNATNIYSANIYAALPTNGHGLREEREQLSREIRSLTALACSATLRFTGHLLSLNRSVNHSDHAAKVKNIFSYRQMLIARNRTVKRSQRALCRKCLGTGVHTFGEEAAIIYCPACGHTPATARLR